MDREKTLFICSKQTPIGLYEQVFQWVDSLTATDCIACFNSTYMESEVLKALLVAKVPTVLFVMNRFTDVNNLQVELALRENRMLIVVLKRDEPRGAGATPRLRNEYVMSLCQHIVCGYVNMNGSVVSLLAGKTNVEHLIGTGVYDMAADEKTRSERWTVAQDKVLLRMFYEDMGIHAIHKQLHRTYLSVYMRLRSITQPEDLLKGREFEDYVLSLFHINETGPLLLLEWQGDKTYGNIRPKNNSNPDFVFSYEDREFAVECKWRVKLDEDLSRKLFTKKQLDNYRLFSSSRKMPVNIVLGVGGEPSYPELIYIIPLERVGDVVSHVCHITDFLCQSHSFNVSQFLRP